MTTWVHGAEETARVEEASRIMFGGSLDGVQERTLELLDEGRARRRDRHEPSSRTASRSSTC